MGGKAAPGRGPPPEPKQRLCRGGKPIHRRRGGRGLDFGKNLDSSVIYDPDLNDGVVLNIAPLWQLVPWKEAKSYWDELLACEYERSSMGKLLRKKGLVK